MTSLNSLFLQTTLSLFMYTISKNDYVCVGAFARLLCRHLQGIGTQELEHPVLSGMLAAGSRQLSLFKGKGAELALLQWETTLLPLLFQN